MVELIEEDLEQGPHVSLGTSNETSWVPSEPCQLSEWMILIQYGPFFIMFGFSCLNFMLTATKGIKVLWALITSLKFRPASTQQLGKEHVYMLKTLELFTFLFPLVAKSDFDTSCLGFLIGVWLFDIYSTKMRSDSESSWETSPSGSED